VKTFTSFAALRSHIAVTEAALDLAVTVGIKEASTEFLHETHEIIGEYQSAAGPYPAWAPLTAATKEDRSSRGYPEDEPELVTGELRDSYEVHAEGFKGGVGSESIIALAQEAGEPAHNLPARPILGFAYIRGEKKVATARSS
jgi:hypothetical protein